MEDKYLRIIEHSKLAFLHFEKSIQILTRRKKAEGPTKN